MVSLLVLRLRDRLIFSVEGVASGEVVILLSKPEVVLEEVVGFLALGTDQVLVCSEGVC